MSSPDGEAGSHPPAEAIMADELAPAVADHLGSCVMCRRLRERRYAETFLDEDETMLPALDARPPGGETVIESGAGPIWQAVRGGLVETRAPHSARSRFEALRTVDSSAVLRWTRFEPGPDHATVYGEAPPTRHFPLPRPLGLLATVVDAVLALADLHERGLAHGGLGGEGALWATEYGDLLLPWPALVVSGPPDEDWVALADRLPAREELAPLVDALRTRSTSRIFRVCTELQTRASHGHPRYTFLEAFGSGQMGSVWLAWDAVLNRRVALKRHGAGDVQQFWCEAQIPAQLQHPAIVSVFDVGQTPDGVPFYTMEVMERSNLGDRFEALHEASRGGDWVDDGTIASLTGLVGALARAAEGVAFAHRSGVVHRDLKPRNIVVGSHGEVRVADWGLAKVLDTATADVRTTRTEHADPLVTGVAGTPAYQAPEVGPGFTGDARRDVFALGATLRELLTGDPTGRFPDPGLPPPPPELQELVERCTAADPDARPADAEAVAQALRDWLDGRARRARAAERLAEAEGHRAAMEAARSESDALLTQARGMLTDVPLWAPVEDKVEAWRIEERAEARQIAAAIAETRYEERLQAARDHDPANRTAREGMADLLWRRLIAAEREDDRKRVARYRTLLEGHGERHRARLALGGRLTLHTDPPGATVQLRRTQEEDRMLVDRPVRELGTTPIDGEPLEPGSYVLVIEHLDCEPVRYPVWIERGRDWDGIAPGESEPHPVALPPRGSLQPDDRVVPAGWFLCGGDALAPDGLPRRWLWVDGFVMKRHPVTFAEYFAFLDHLLEVGRDLDEHVPSRTTLDGFLPLLERRDGTWGPTRHATGQLAIEPAMPVNAIPWHAAVAFARWRSAVEDAAWRLPHDGEWEKAARGVDGRPFPFGRHFDPALACTLRSWPSDRVPSAVSVDAFPHDVSVYGVRGMAGNVRNWCANGYRRAGPAHVRVDPTEAADGEYRMARGSTFYSLGNQSRSASRFVGRPTGRQPNLGFRLVRSLSR